MTHAVTRLTAALADRYRIERELGEGGMATVYLAEDLKHDRLVALKVLKPELAAVVGGERFLAEIKTTANLQHPHILPLFDSGQDSGLLWYVMPYIQGETLQQRLDRERQLPVGEAVAITVKVASALQTAHDQGIVHRDIKPANILLMNGEPLVADFGIALAVQEAGGGRLTETGLSMGTPFYMSPEQATADRTPDARADVYSLGCVLYEMLAGEPPFTGSSAQAVLGRILTQAPRPVTEERPSVPANVASAVDRALHKLPADRFAGADEFARALRDPQFLSGEHPAAVHAGVRRSRLPAWAPWGIAAGAVMIAAVATLTRRGGEGAAAPPAPVRFTLEDRSDPGFYGDRFLRITPDGGTIVFRRRTPDGTMLYRRELGSTEAVPIEGTAAATDVAISTDGRWLAFNDEVSPEPRVLRLPIEGGVPSEIIEPPNEPIGISWVDEDELLFGMLAFDDEYPGLTATRISDPQIRVITELANSESFDMHHEPEVLPGGTHALFLDFTDPDVRLGLVDIASGETRPIDLGGVTIRGTESIAGVAGDRLLFLDTSDRLMAVSWDPERMETLGDPVPVPGVPDGILDAVMSPEGTLAMTLVGQGFRPVIVDDRGSVVRELWDAGLSRFVPRLSPDGQRLAVMLPEFRGTRDIWVYDLVTEDLIPLGVGDETPVWSADGREIFFARVLWGGEFERTASAVFAVPSEGGSAPEEVTRLDPPSRIEAVTARTADGKFVAVQDRGPNPEMARLDVTIVTPGEPVPELYAAALPREVAPRLSPDQRWLAYTSFESGRPQVYVRSFPDGEGRLLVWPDQAGMPVWDPSGDRLYVRTFDGIAAVDLVERGGRFQVAGRTTLFTAEIAGRVSSREATYDVHPDGFIVALDDTERAGRVVVWKDWIHELDPLLEGER